MLYRYVERLPLTSFRPKVVDGFDHLINQFLIIFCKPQKSSVHVDLRDEFFDVIWLRYIRGRVLEGPATDDRTLAQYLLGCPIVC